MLWHRDRNRHKHVLAMGQEMVSIQARLYYYRRAQNVLYLLSEFFLQRDSLLMYDLCFVVSILRNIHFFIPVNVIFH